MDTLPPLVSEKFELLSAYLDGEVTPTERQQVEDWLVSDIELQQTYQQMLTLQGGLKTMPIAPPAMSSVQLAEHVMRRLDRQQTHRWIWGGVGTITALLLGAMSGVFTGHQGGTLQMAQRPKPQPSSVVLSQSPDPTTVAIRTGDSNNTRALMIVLERPPVDIPVVPASNKTNLDNNGL